MNFRDFFLTKKFFFQLLLHRRIELFGQNFVAAVVQNEHRRRFGGSGGAQDVPLRAADVRFGDVSEREKPGLC